MPTEPARASAPAPAQRAIKDVIRGAKPRLTALLVSYRIPPEDAEDLLQETFLCLVRQWDDVRHDVVYPDLWHIHLLWATILVFILTKGPGAISLDHVIAKTLLPHRRQHA